MNRVLIVEDEKHLGDGLRFNLEAEGYQVEWVETGEEALQRFTLVDTPFDVVILDVMLPGKNGFDVIAQMRLSGLFTPTLMLTARGHPQDVLRGFEAGADDYLVKPFELAILIARIHGLLRRRAWLQDSSIGVPPRKLKDVFAFGESSDRVVDFDSLELRVGDKVFRLTSMEAGLLRYLIEHEGEAVSRKAMLQNVWSLQEDTDTRPIDNFVVRLRRYLEEDPTRPQHLLTVRGIGYRFVAVPKKP